MATNKHILVWDPLVRIFHWALAGSFAAAYLTEDHFLTMHSWLGYLAIVLISVRLIWGFFGTRHARFSDFVYRPSVVIRYLQTVVAFRAARHVGHNPAGGYMVLALMSLVLLTGMSGIAVYGIQEFSGPLAPYVADLPHSWGEAAEDLHELLANLALLLIGLHLVGVAVASAQHQENLVRAMLTGRKISENS